MGEGAIFQFIIFWGIGNSYKNWHVKIQLQTDAWRDKEIMKTEQCSIVVICFLIFQPGISSSKNLIVKVDEPQQINDTTILLNRPKTQLKNVPRECNSCV